MSMSLRDQLIQAGLGTKKQVKEATQPKKAVSRHQPPPISPEKLAAQKAAAAKSGDRAGIMGITALLTLPCVTLACAAWLCRFRYGGAMMAL